MCIRNSKVAPVSHGSGVILQPINYCTHWSRFLCRGLNKLQIGQLSVKLSPALVSNPDPPSFPIFVFLKAYHFYFRKKKPIVYVTERRWLDRKLPYLQFNSTKSLWCRMDDLKFGLLKFGYMITSGWSYTIEYCRLQSHYKEAGKAPAEDVTIHRIRITLTSRNVKSLEKGTHF